MIAAAAGPKRILVIEDNPDLAYGLRNNLEIEGYDVEVAKDGTRGLQRARSAPNPDLVVLDLMLPGMDGFRDRKSTRLNSSHDQISYAVFCLKKKKFTPSIFSSIPITLPIRISPTRARATPF